MPSRRGPLAHGASTAPAAIDVYGNTGLAAGDIDDDGFDDLYICQPAGLPNRLYRNRGDGTFDDVTEASGVGVLERYRLCPVRRFSTNRGVQDLLVVCGSGPLLFLNDGHGKFSLKRDAFSIRACAAGHVQPAPPSPTYDNDGRLDIYFCSTATISGSTSITTCSVLRRAKRPAQFSAAQRRQRYVPRSYRSRRTSTWTTIAIASRAHGATSIRTATLNLYVANDFGRSNLYRNNGDGTFTSVATQKKRRKRGGCRGSGCRNERNLVRLRY